MNVWEVILWALPRFAVWVMLSIIPMNTIINLSSEDEEKNRLKIAGLFALIFFVFAPLCFGVQF